MKRGLALVMAVMLLLPGWARAAEYYSAQTPLEGAGENKLNNLRLAAEAIDATSVPKGGGFSFNETVGPRVDWRGYLRAPNGRGALVTGGGVAQAATTLYMALLQMAEVVIDPVRTYGERFADSYVSDPDLAVVTDYDADIDLSFTNLGEPMSIDMWLGDEYLYCSISAGESEDGGFWTGPLAAADDEPRPRPSGLNREVPVCSASLDCGGDADVLNNVTLAAECVNDTTLVSRDVFSFNDIVGPRAQKYGYRRAVNGRGVKVTGGGVAQVASVLWLAVKDWDRAAIVEKSTYGEKYNQRYVASSADAILTDYASGRDFSFRYTGADSLTVYTWVDEGTLYCEMYER